MADTQPIRTVTQTTTLAALTLLGLLLRSLRLTWQPLWWDEGYSVFFATEHFLRMLNLTALDIHPPLYYALLHLWTSLAHSAKPDVIRLPSVAVGVLAIPAIAWLAHIIFAPRHRIAFLAALLLALSPIHIFYSQEVRMYGLAMLLSIVASGMFWRLILRIDGEQPLRWAIVSYAISGILSLLTLYYLAFLLLAHLLWAVWHFRSTLGKLVPILVGDTLMVLGNLGWWLYAIPRLIPYVSDKVLADKDAPISFALYLSRHVLAFLVGAVASPSLLLTTLTYMGLIGVVAGLLATWFPRLLRQSHPVGMPITRTGKPIPQDGVGAVTTFLLVPILAGFFVNLRLPFFPEGGERLLLFALPYFLLLIAYGIDTLLTRPAIAYATLAVVLLNALAGIGIFYSTPRHEDHDYRPIVDFVTQRGNPGDTVLALFPWQVGYWRAYTARDSEGKLYTPQPKPVGQNALVWDSSIREKLEIALRSGTIWFPAPLSFGSTLPFEIERYLDASSVNIEDRWFGDATKLGAWSTALHVETVQGPNGLEPLILQRSGVTPHTVDSANEVLSVNLVWNTQFDPSRFHATLSLKDSTGHTWAARDYEPLGRFSSSSSQLPTATAVITDVLGFLVPVGVPPGPYSLTVGTRPIHAQSDIGRNEAQGSFPEVSVVAQITLTQPDYTIPSVRLSIPIPLAPSTEHAGIALLGSGGINAQDTFLTGTEIPVTLFLANTSSSPQDQNVFVSVLDKDAVEVAGYEGWPLTGNPISAWSEGTLTQVPAHFYLPATLPSGEYRLVGGLSNPVTGIRELSQPLAEFWVEQRLADFRRIQPSHELTPTVQFGTHAVLYGHDIEYDGEQMEVHLYWEVLQTLLPSHHIFVHVNTSDGLTVAQHDGEPSMLDAPAPSGSWLPGEHLITKHRIVVPEDYLLPDTSVEIQVGLYKPRSGVRLPAAIKGRPIGDAAGIAIK